MSDPVLTPIHKKNLKDQDSFFLLSALRGSTHQSTIRRTDDMNRTAQFDNHGRRSGADRRQFTYAVHIPERRVDENRRLTTDRRLKPRP